MWKWLLALVVLIILPSLLIFKTGVTPRPVPLIDSSRIENPGQAGVLAYRVLRHELPTYGVVLLGLADRAGMEQLRAGFVRAARSQGDDLLVINGPDWKAAKQAMLQGRRVVVTLPTADLFGPARQHILKAARQELKVEPLTVATAPVDGRECARDLHFDYEDSSFVPCASQYMQRKTARKKAITSHPAMALEQFGRSVYMLFLWGTN